ncbi:MAG: tetratricopeptide repeat protein [Candidatus Berkelbacteria bacterium]|nr:tetratricopeptide repeat protein [Candidatus Berkelbacteria bacterium]
MNRDRTKSTILYLLVLVVLATSFIIFGVFYLKDAKTSDKNSTTSTATVPTGDNQNQNLEELPPDQKLYAAAIESIDAKNYNQAISNLTEAIKENPDNPSYYSVKSEAEVLAGKKDDAIATLEAGLKINPDNEVLNSKLDVLQKNDLAPANQDTPRQ